MKCSWAAERSFSSEACHFAMNSFGGHRYPCVETSRTCGSSVQASAPVVSRNELPVATSAGTLLFQKLQIGHPIIRPWLAGS